jgi:hypothetical protein
MSESTDMHTTCITEDDDAALGSGAVVRERGCHRLEVVGGAQSRGRAVLLPVTADVRGGEAGRACCGM